MACGATSARTGSRRRSSFLCTYEVALANAGVSNVRDGLHECVADEEPITSLWVDAAHSRGLQLRNRRGRRKLRAYLGRRVATPELLHAWARTPEVWP